MQPDMTPRPARDIPNLRDLLLLLPVQALARDREGHSIIAE